jgi:hypothetical protein
MGSFLLGASGSIAACGGDDSTATEQDSGSDVTTTPTDSGGQGDTSSSGDSNTDTAKANASDVTIYLGQIAALDGTTSTPAAASFAWTVESAPAGSTVVTSSLLNAATAKPTFTPDLAGDYSLKLTVTSGSATDSKVVKVKAVHAPVFYVNQNNQTEAGGPTVDLRVITSGGTDGHGVSCGVPDDGGSASSTTRRAYAGGSDWLEGAPGQEAKVAFTMDERGGDAAYESYLATGTSSSTCNGASKPKKVDNAANAAPNQTGSFYFPKISPDGARVLYVRNFTTGPVGARVATVAFDGTAAHSSISPYNAYADGGVQADSGFFNGFGGASNANTYVPPRWAPGNKVSWAVSFSNSTRWQILVADDADNATPTPMMTCSGTVLEYDFLADGTVIASAAVPLADGAPPATDLVVLRPNAVTKECEVVKNLTNLASNTGSVATDFSLSPDKRRVAFLMSDNTVDAGAGITNSVLFTAAVDGSQPPAKVPGVPYGAATRGQGPRWIAGGTALAWGQSQSTIDAGDAGGMAVAVVSAGGGNARAVVATSATDGVSAIGNTLCSMSHGPGSALMAFGSLAAFVGLVARRRRRR